MNKPETRCVLYARSSKDESDIAPATQLEALRTFAASRGYVVVGEHSDSAVSANDNPPQLRALLRHLQNPDRGWSMIVAMDKSRITRNTNLSGVIGTQMESAGCTFDYAKHPRTGEPIADLWMDAMQTTQAHQHSMSSKGDAIRGMRKIVAGGNRAGGSAPWPYGLKHEVLGKNKRGNLIRRSTLYIKDARGAKLLTAYLQARAQNVPRLVAAKEAKLERSYTTLIAYERNALCYAGYLTWNLREKVKSETAEKGKKMRWRPREEWHVSEEPVHPALINACRSRRDRQARR